LCAIKLEELSYLDIHTHLRNVHPNALSVSSLAMDEILSSTLPSQHITAGIHPWWLEELSTEEISQLQKQIQKLLLDGKLWGIGETGIDRGYPESFERQKQLFLWHMDLSEKTGLPLILHSVRSGSDFLEILKEYKPKSAWIFHDFRGNENLLKDLLRLHHESYFSFGLSIDNSPETRKLLPKIPLDKLFLETDDQKHLDIHDIYLRASHHLGVELNYLKSQLIYNFKRVSKFSV
jgi:TatD DNase family protein